MVVELPPVTVVGLALTVECVAIHLGGLECDDRLLGRACTLSVVSTAVSVTGSADGVGHGEGRLPVGIRHGRRRPRDLRRRGRRGQA